MNFSSVSAAIITLLAVLSPGATSAAQQPWQHLQMPSASEVLDIWKSPPPGYGPEPYYGLNGPVTEAVFEHDLDSMKSMGFRAVTVQYGYGSSFEYLSPEFFDFFRKFVAAAKRRGMRVWIVDDAGYPSGFAGGKFSTLKPDLRMQALVAAKRIPVNGGDVVQQAVTPETVAVAAIKADGMAIAIPVESGSIHWTAPPGGWQVVIVEHGFRTSPTRSDTNKQRVKDTSQSLEDYLNPEATRQFLEFTHEQYKRALGDEFGKTILGFRGDEPDFSIGGLPWTPTFFDRFQQIKGYDVRRYLATFFTPKAPETSPPMTDEERRAKADYLDVFSQMFRDGFFKVQGEWCARNHLEYQVHLNHEEQQMELVRSEGEFFRDMRDVQVPGVDSIWHQIWTDTVSDFPRLASSVSHVYGKPRAFTESFAAYRPEPDVNMARYILNEQFVRGINQVETMYFPASSTSGRLPSPYMRQPGFPELLAYTSRMSYLLSMGRPVATVGLYLPSCSFWMSDEASNRSFVATEQMLSERQIDFDIVSDDALGHDLKAVKGSFETGSGNQLTTVIVPSAVVISQATYDRLKSFAEGGGHVLFLERLPQLIAGQSFLSAHHATPAEFSWAASVLTETLPMPPTPPAYPPESPPVPQVVPATIDIAVAKAVGSPTVSLDARDTSVRAMRRRLKDADLYVLFNEGPKQTSHRIVVRGTGKKVELWDAATGDSHALSSTPRNGGREVSVTIAPYEEKVIVLR